jgi:hypothetical protein
VSLTRLFDRPIFIIGCNRSGTTLLFNTLSYHPLLWSRYEESYHVYHRFFPIDAELGEAVPNPAKPPIREALLEQLYREGHNKEFFKDHPFLWPIPRKALQTPINPVYKRPPIRLIEKTPANCLRIPLLADLFPDGRFVFLVRRPEDTISSLMEGWKLGLARMVFERDSSIDDEKLRSARWHYLVPQGWSQWVGRPLAEICTFQWVSSVQAAWEDLNQHCPDRMLLLRHEDAIRDPVGVYQRLSEFCEIPASGYFTTCFPKLQAIPHTHGGSEPARDKWRRLHGEEIESVRPTFAALKAMFYGED